MNSSDLSASSSESWWWSMHCNSFSISVNRETCLLHCSTISDSFANNNRSTRRWWVDRVAEQDDIVESDWVDLATIFNFIFIYFLSFMHNPKSKLPTMAERGLVMVMHSVIIGVILYAIMTFLMHQSAAVAENRSICIAAVVLIYMIVFGHGMPGHINSNI